MATRKVPNYRSKFEKSVGDLLGPDAVHEPERIKFVQPAKERIYIPDFRTVANVYIEAKGKWTLEDRMKHIWLKEQHPSKRIVLVFQNSNQRLSKKSKTTYGEWATKNNIEWYDINNIPKEIVNENNKSRRDR